MEQKIELSESQKRLAKIFMQTALQEKEAQEGHPLKNLKEVELVLQGALEKFAKKHLKDENITCWWQLTNYEDIFDYLFFGQHTIDETIDHFASILSIEKR